MAGLAKNEDPDYRAVNPGQRVPLTDLLSSHKRLLIIGEPGGGKTTFLKLIACVLAKDAEGKGKPGRKQHLGLSLDPPASVPVYMRVPVLAEILKENNTGAGSGSAWRVFIKAMDRHYGHEQSCLLQKLLDKGECALLLDGLDEVADENLRNRIVEVVNSAMNRWKQNLMVISSRPFGYHDIAALDEMATASIDAFGEDEILEFLERWGQGLYRENEEKSRAAYMPDLKKAIIDSSPIRKLARNPVMLTCLCVVHWNERRLPEGKADLLAAVMKWLLNAREVNRKERGYTNRFAEEAFKTLALAMTNHPDGKQV
ncbi:MAG: NACHT domain-containing protein [Desulfobacteraceae bacterium]|nr:NACHT domain-containing protein [Desulfobacteraceae bacterium]